jgi:hypothetical protein
LSSSLGEVPFAYAADDPSDFRLLRAREVELLGSRIGLRCVFADEPEFESAFEFESVSVMEIETETETDC